MSVPQPIYFFHSIIPPDYRTFCCCNVALYNIYKKKIKNLMILINNKKAKSSLYSGTFDFIFLSETFFNFCFH